jgi:hypothetical protein|eukprot:scaffold2045_cov203-Alexandrium_tamarense.AAC.5
MTIEQNNGNDDEDYDEQLDNLLLRVQKIGTTLGNDNNMEAGRTVQFRGLTESSHLNGTRGILEYYVEDKQRWSVRCDVDNGIVNAKVDNLALLDDGEPMIKKISSDSFSSSVTDSTKWKVQECPQDCGLIPTLAVTLWLGWNGIVVCIAVYLLFIANNIERMVIIGLATMSLILPAHFPGALGYKIGDWIMRQAEKYFGLKTVIEDEEDLIRHANENKAVIFAFNPHDMLPYAVFAFAPTLKRLPGKIGKDGTCLMSSAIFNIPFLRQVYTWVNSLPVDKKTFLGRLKRGQSFAFVPGGVQEVIMLDPNQPKDVVLYLKNRKGFVKLALATGSPIVPVFGFHLDGR